MNFNCDINGVRHSVSASLPNNSGSLMINIEGNQSDAADIDAKMRQVAAAGLRLLACSRVNDSPVLRSFSYAIDGATVEQQIAILNGLGVSESDIHSAREQESQRYREQESRFENDRSQGHSNVVRHSPENQKAKNLQETLAELIPDLNASQYASLIKHEKASLLNAFIQRMMLQWPEYDAQLVVYTHLAVTDESFLNAWIDEIESSSTNCGDRPLYFFSKFSALASIYQAGAANDLKMVAENSLKLYQLQIIEESVFEFFKDKGNLEDHQHELLEVALYLQLELKGPLHLPIAATTMLNRGSAYHHLGSEEAAQALVAQVKQRCEAAINSEEKRIQAFLLSPFLRKEFERNSQYQELLKKFDPPYEAALNILEGDSVEIPRNIAMQANRLIRDSIPQECNNKMPKDLNENQYNLTLKNLQALRQKNLDTEIHKALEPYAQELEAAFSS